MHVPVYVVVLWLTAHGCSAAGAVGITANLWVESRLVPTASASGLGLPQLVAERRSRMLASLGARWHEWDAQLGWMRAEALSRLDRRRVSDWTATCSAPDAATATAVWFRRYERGRGLAVRLRVAREIARCVAESRACSVPAGGG